MWQWLHMQLNFESLALREETCTNIKNLTSSNCSSWINVVLSEKLLQHLLMCQSPRDFNKHHNGSAALHLQEHQNSHFHVWFPIIIQSQLNWESRMNLTHLQNLTLADYYMDIVTSTTIHSLSCTNIYFDRHFHQTIYKNTKQPHIHDTFPPHLFMQ